MSHKTVAGWVAILERLYAVFRLAPFGAPRLRAVKKEQKHYHFDWSLVPDEGPRFENLVASHLLKWVHHEQDVQGRDVELRYFRDTDGREVDFVVEERRRPILLVEAKWGDMDVDRSLRYMKDAFPVVRRLAGACDGTEGLRHAGGDSCRSGAATPEHPRMMTERDLRTLLSVAQDAAYIGGRRTLAYFGTGTAAAELKPDQTPVTLADREAERLIRDVIGRIFPDHAILGEEDGETAAAQARRQFAGSSTRSTARARSSAACRSTAR